MSLNSTPSANRLHIGIYGKTKQRGSPRSSTRSDQGSTRRWSSPDGPRHHHRPGLQGDGAATAMRPVVLIDTAGLDDEGELGRAARRKDEAQDCGHKDRRCARRSWLRRPTWSGSGSRLDFDAAGTRDSLLSRSLGKAGHRCPTFRRPRQPPCTSIFLGLPGCCRSVRKERTGIEDAVAAAIRRKPAGRLRTPSASPAGLGRAGRIPCPARHAAGHSGAARAASSCRRCRPSASCSTRLHRRHAPASPTSELDAGARRARKAAEAASSPIHQALPTLV